MYSNGLTKNTYMYIRNVLRVSIFHKALWALVSIITLWSIVALILPPLSYIIPAV